METTHPHDVEKKNNCYDARAPNDKHCDNDSTNWKDNWTNSKVLQSFFQWVFFYFMTFSQNVQKNNEEEETECEVVRFDHVYQKNDDTEFRIEMPISFACLWMNFMIFHKILCRYFINWWRK